MNLYQLNATSALNQTPNQPPLFRSVPRLVPNWFLLGMSRQSPAAGSVILAGIMLKLVT